MGNKTEEWRDAVGFEGFYQVSCRGRVKSLSRSAYNGAGYFFTKERIIKPFAINGYLYFKGCKRGKKKNESIHRLVALTFLQSPKRERIHVNHKDLNRGNNCIENLEWVTQQENHTHQQKHRSKKGYVFCKDKKKFRVAIRCPGVMVYLGQFETKEEAQACYFKTYREFFGYDPILEN
jgi:hypothetical protein